MNRPTLNWFRLNLIWLNAAMLLLGCMIIVDFRYNRDATMLQAFFTYGAGPFYFLCGLIEAFFAWRVAREFEHDEPMRLPWSLMAVSGLVHAAAEVFTNVLSKPSYLNPVFLLGSGWTPELSQLLRKTGTMYLGNVRYLLFAVAFFLVLRAERRVGVRWQLSASEMLILFGTGIWLGIHTSSLFDWMNTLRAPTTLEKLLSWGLDFLLGMLTMMAIFVRSSIRHLEPGLLARAWRSYIWGIFFTCAGNAGIWATAYGMVLPPYSDLFWLIWFPQVTLFALAPIWQCQAMLAARGEWMPELDQKLASEARTT